MHGVLQSRSRLLWAGAIMNYELLRGTSFYFIVNFTIL